MGVGRLSGVLLLRCDVFLLSGTVFFHLLQLAAHQCQYWRGLQAVYRPQLSPNFTPTCGQLRATCPRSAPTCRSHTPGCPPVRSGCTGASRRRCRPTATRIAAGYPAAAVDQQVFHFRQPHTVDFKLVVAPLREVADLPAREAYLAGFAVLRRCQFTDHCWISSKRFLVCGGSWSR